MVALDDQATLSALMYHRPPVPYYREVERDADIGDEQAAKIIAEVTNSNQASSRATMNVEPSVTFKMSFELKQKEAMQRYLTALSRINDRLNELKGIAASEGIKGSPSSEEDLLAFFNSRVDTARPFIALLDNGNYRAVWKGVDGSQIGLQFLGDKIVQYVLLAPRDNGAFLAQSAGRDELTAIRRQIIAFKLDGLMNS